MVTPDDIAVALGRTTPVAGSVEYAQWNLWIEDAQRLIQARLGDLSLLNQDNLDYVIREAVVAQVRRPDDSTSVDIAIDDGRVSKRFSSGSGRVWIRPEWWILLDPDSATGKAFEIDTTPSGAGAQHGVDYWWSTPTHQVWL